MIDKKAPNTQSRVLKVRVFPTETQKKVINQTFGACRFIYNNYLQERSEFYIEHIMPVKKTSTKQELQEIYKTFKRTPDKEYGQLYPWMKETSSTARHEATRHLDAAYSRFFDNCKKHRKVGRKIYMINPSSPKKLPSKNKEKARAKLARLEERISDKRKDWIEKETLRLARTYDKVVVENLNLKGISSFLRNAKNMNDTSWATFVSRLEAKGKDYDCLVVKADRYFASSQICSKCGYQNHALTLRDRTWACPDCGSNHIRDLNAAINLRNYVPLGRGKLTPMDTGKEGYVALLAAQALTV